MHTTLTRQGWRVTDWFSALTLSNNPKRELLENGGGLRVQDVLDLARTQEIKTQWVTLAGGDLTAVMIHGEHVSHLQDPCSAVLWESVNGMAVPLGALAWVLREQSERFARARVQHSHPLSSLKRQGLHWTGTGTEGCAALRGEELYRMILAVKDVTTPLWIDGQPVRALWEADGVVHARVYAPANVRMERLQGLAKDPFWAGATLRGLTGVPLEQVNGRLYHANKLPGPTLERLSIGGCLKSQALFLGTSEVRWVMPDLSGRTIWVATRDPREEDVPWVDPLQQIGRAVRAWSHEPEPKTEPETKTERALSIDRVQAWLATCSMGDRPMSVLVNGRPLTALEVREESDGSLSLNLKSR